MQNSNSELRQRVDSFVQDLEQLIRESALEAVQEALGFGAKPGKRAAAAKRAPRAASAKAKSGKRIRRSADGLAKIADAIVSHVRSNPGQGIESISGTLGLPSKELRRPVQMMLAEGKLRTEGQKRGTIYFTSRGGAASKTKGAPKKKATRRKKASRR